MKMTYEILFIWSCIVLNLHAAPIYRRMVDLTYTFRETSHKFPPFKPFNLTVIMNGTMDSTEIWIQAEEYSSSTHVGTHMDAPSHFVPGGTEIDEIPVEQFVAPAAVIDITEKANLNPDVGVTVDDLLNWESISGYSLDGTIVLMRSGWGRFYNNRTAYIGMSGDDTTKMHFPGFEPEAAQWLVENRKINGVGTDALSFDKGVSQDFRSHILLLGNGIFGLENVANLEKIPISGATLYVMPMKLNASGAPTRVVASYPEVVFSSRSEN